MKLVQRTSNTLTMRYVPWGMWLMMSYVIAKFLLIVGFLLIGGFPHQVALTCTRNVQQPTQGQCQLTGTNVQGTDQRRWDLDQITAAIPIAASNAQNREVYRLALITKQEQVALPLSSTHIGDIQRQVAKIQEFLANPAQTHLTVQQDNPWIVTLVVILLIVLGGLLTYTIGVGGSIRTLRLNKITGKLTLQQHTLWGSKLVEYPLKKVADVVVIRGKYHQVAILLSQEKLDLSNMSLLSKLMWLRGSLLYLYPTFGLSLRWFECKRCAKQIRDFLDLPSKSE